MPEVLTTPPLVQRWEAWTDWECDGGERVAVVPNSRGNPAVSSARRRRAIEDHVQRTRVDLGLLRQLRDWAEYHEGRVLRAVRSGGADAFDEFRILAFEELVERSGGEVATLHARGPEDDLWTGALLERVEADGLARPRFEVLGRTPEEQLQIMLGQLGQPFVVGAPGWVQIGTVEPTDVVDMIYEWDSVGSAASELARITNAEWRLRRVGTTHYELDLVFQIVEPGAKKALIKPGRNATRIVHVSSAEEQGTRIYPQGGDLEGEPSTMQDNAWRVAGTSGSIVTLGADVMNEDGQLDGLFVRRTDGSLAEIIDSTAPNVLTLDSLGAIAEGDEVSIRRDDRGGGLTYVESPSRILGLDGSPAYGIIPRLLERGDIPAINNLLGNPLLREWSAGLPVDFFVQGAAVVSQNLNPDFYLDGNSSAHIVAAEAGDGLVTASTRVFPTARRPHFAAEAAVRLVSGAVELEVWDWTDGGTGSRQVEWPPVESNVRPRTEEIGTWVEDLGYGPGENFHEIATTHLRVAILAAEDGTEFYLDKAQLTQNPEPLQQFYGGRAANDLWLLALRELLLRRDPLSEYQVEAIDRSRVDARQELVGARYKPIGWPDEGFWLGAEARVMVPSIDFDRDVRVMAIEDDLEREAQEKIELETELDTLTRQRAASERRRKQPQRPVAENTQVPQCPSWIRAWRQGDLEVMWERTNFARASGKSVDPDEADPDVAWDNGTYLFRGIDGDTWVLLEGDEAGGLAPADIGRIMVEVYNKWGVPGCRLDIDVAAAELETPCVNVMGADGEDTHCSEGAGAGEVDVYTYEDIPVGRLGGASRVSYCYDGATQFGPEDPDPTEERSVRMVQAVVESDLLGQHWIGAMVHSSTGNAEHDDRLSAAMSISRDLGDGIEKFAIQEWVDDASTTLATANVPDKAGSTPYRVSIAADGAEVAAYDFDSETLLEATASTRVSGFGGVAANDTDFMRTQEYYDCAGRHLTVSGLSSGQKAQVLDDADAVLGGATESGGTASVDMTSVDLTAAAAVVVTDSAGTELARFTPGGGQKPIAGGDGYSYSGGAIGRHTAGLIAHHIAGSSAPFKTEHWERGLHCTLPEIAGDGSLRTNAFESTHWYGVRYKGGSGGGSAEEGDVLAALDLELLDADEVVLAAHVDPGVQSSALDDFVRGIGAQGMEIPEGTATLRLKAKKKGDDAGDICLRRVQLNVGSSCCAFASPGTPLAPNPQDIFTFDRLTATVDCTSAPIDLDVGIVWTVSEDVLSAAEGVYTVRATVLRVEEDGTAIQLYSQIHQPHDSPLNLNFPDEFADASETEGVEIKVLLTLRLFDQTWVPTEKSVPVSCDQDFTDAIHILQVAASVADCASGGGLDLTIDLDVDALVLADPDRFDFRVTVWEVPSADGSTPGGQVYQQTHEVAEQITVNLPDRYSDATNATSHTLDVSVVLLDRGSSVDSDAEATTATYGDTCP